MFFVACFIFNLRSTPLKVKNTAFVLSFEVGASWCRAGLYAPDGALLAEERAQGANPAECGESAAAARLIALGKTLLPANAAPLRVAAGIAGAREKDRQISLAKTLCAGLQATRAIVSTDLHPLLFANAPQGEAILAIAGTGSCVLAKDQKERLTRIGGRGGFVGDEGSAYWIGQHALRAAAKAEDGILPPTALTNALCDALDLESFDAVAAWAHTANKRAIAALAATVETCMKQGDAAAADLIQSAARALLRQVQAAQQRLNLAHDVPVFLHGGLLQPEREFHACFKKNATEACQYTLKLPKTTGHPAVRWMALQEPPPALGSGLYPAKRAPRGTRNTPPPPNRGT